MAPTNPSRFAGPASSPGREGARANPPRVAFARWLPVQPRARAAGWSSAAKKPERRSLLVTVNYPPSVGGMESYYAALARHFPPGRLVVSTPPREGSREFDAEHVVPVSRPPIPRRHAHLGVFVLVWWLHAAFVALLRDIRFLHCGNAAPAGWICRWLGRALGIPYAVYFHGMDVEKLSRTLRAGGFRGRSMRRVLDDAALLFANSADTRRRLVAAGADPARIVLVHPGVDAERFHPSRKEGAEGGISEAGGGQGGGALLLTVGRYAERKGVDRLIRALPRVLREVPAARLVVAGRRQEEHLGGLVDALGLREHVAFRGEVGDAELPALYRSADVFAMPAGEDEATGSVEGFGIVFLEAAASGLPSIGGRTGGIADAIEDGVTGYLVKPGDEDELVRRLVELLANPARRRAMGEAARARAVRDFGWERAAAAVIEAMRSVP